MTQSGSEQNSQDALRQAYDNIQLQLNHAQSEVVYWRTSALSGQQQTGSENTATSITTDGRSIAGVDIFMLRLHAGLIKYINSSFCHYLQSPKDELIGQDVEVLKRFLSPTLVDMMSNPAEDTVNTQLTDEERNTILDVRITRQGDLIDIVLQDVTNQEVFKSYILRYIPTELRNLTEEDLNTFRYPDRRFMTVSFVDLRSFTELSEKMSPEEVRTTINNYLEEVMSAVEENHGTVDKIIGDEVMSLFGAPRYYHDHALRAIKTACEQVHRVKLLQQQFLEVGKLLPHCGAGINTGEMVVGNIGSQNRHDYTALGSSVNMAARLCDAARPGEVLLTEPTLKAALTALPEFWDSMETTWEQQDLVGFTGGKVEGVYLLEGNLQNKAVLIGPGVNEDPTRAEYVFRYLYALKIKGISDLVPVISVTCPKIEVTLQLDDGKVVQTETERILGRYRLTEMIKRGGMGEVWRGKDAFGNEVAVKTLIAGEVASDRQIRRFKREAQMMARLVHRRICRIFEVGEVDQVSYIVMEYVKGIDLADLIDWPEGRPPDYGEFTLEGFNLVNLVNDVKKGVQKLPPAPSENEPKTKDSTYRVLPEQVTTQVMIGICGAVQYAHSHGVLHRDLKPSNIMIREDGEPVVMDFGLAKAEGHTSQEVSVSLSMSGELIGTLEYMAPEQAVDSRNITPAADVYSLGTILYQMVTGVKAFNSSGNLLADIQALQAHTPISPRKLNHHCSPDLEIIIMKALQNDPKDRYPTISALRGDLERYRNGEVITARSSSVLDRTVKLVNRNRALSFAVMLFIGAIFGIGVIWSVQNRSRTIELEAKNEKLEKALADIQEVTRKADEAKLQAEKNEEKAKYAVLQTEKTEQKVKETVAEVSDFKTKLAKTFIEQANQYKKAGDMKSAIQSARQATEQVAGYPDSWWTLGNLLSADQQYDQAVAVFDQAVQSFPDDSRFKDAAKKAHQDLDQFKSFKSQYQMRLAKGEVISREDHLRAANLFLESKEFGAAATSFSMANRSPNVFSPDIRIQQLIADIRKINPDSDPSRKRCDYSAGVFQKVDLSGDALTALPPLEGMNIKQLILSGTQISDLSPLAGSKIHRLDFARSQVTNFAPLHDTGVKELDLTGGKITDLASLAEISLQTLNLTATQVKDLSPLGSNPPENLILTSTPVDDLSPVAGGKFKLLDASHTQIKSIKLSSAFRAAQLNLEGTHISDVEGLAGLTIEQLNISHTDVKDVTSLEYNQLKSLDISHTEIDSIQPLSRMPLKTLDIRVTRVRDLAALTTCPLETLRLTPQRIIGGYEILRSISTLKQIGDEQMMSPAEFFAHNSAGSP